MKKAKIKLAIGLDAKVEVDGYLICDGAFAVHREYKTVERESRTWTISHIGTGRSVNSNSHPSRYKAVEFAERLYECKVFDWGAADIETFMQVNGEVFHLLNELGYGRISLSECEVSIMRLQMGV
jgi:hypothetical protein